MEWLSIDSIQTNNKYLRLNGDVEKLKKSIDTVGPINPLILNKQNVLLAGGRRYTAMKELGFDKVPVVFVDKPELEQELISIDENLVRKSLNTVEMEEALSRACEIYTNLHPGLPSMDEELVHEKENPESRLTDKETFLEYTASKTGLSKQAIKKAIDRDQKASSIVKEARLHGDLNASQTNELIKLESDEQEQVADIAIGRSAAEIKKIVKRVQELGADKAIEEVRNEVPMPKEYKNLKTMIARTNKVIAKILLEEMHCDHEDMDKIKKDVETLRNQIDQFLTLNNGSYSYSNTEMDESEEDYSSDSAPAASGEQDSVDEMSY